jgi:dTMP kinase
VDGPSGAGKSTIVRHLAQLLVAEGEDVHVTAEPSDGPIGALCRELTESVTGHALACLYAADRYHHVDTEVRPFVEQGQMVISDRYVPSGLVMQRFDGIDPQFLWWLNSEAARPDLAVILEADPEVIAERLHDRGPHNRFQLTPGSAHAEAHFYRQATERLVQAGFDVLRVDCNRQPSEQSAVLIRDRLLTFFASFKE